jgi:cardiolipin synthase
MLHAKTAVVDDTWATVGSFNLDSLSMRFNYEANIVGARPEFTQEVRSFFEKDVIRSEEVLLADWQTRSRSNKFFETLSLPVRRFL